MWSPFFFRLQLLLQFGVGRLQLFDALGKLFGLLPPFFAAFGDIVDTVLQPFGVGFDVHEFVLPVVPTS